MRIRSAARLKKRSRTRLETRQGLCNESRFAGSWARGFARSRWKHLGESRPSQGNSPPFHPDASKALGPANPRAREPANRDSPEKRTRLTVVRAKRIELATLPAGYEAVA